LNSSGYPSAALVLYNVLFPRDLVSFNELFALSNVEEFQQQRISQTAFTNFTAAKCFGILYHMWYKMTPKLAPKHALNASDAVMCDSMEKISLEGTTACPNDEYCKEETVYYTLNWLSSILLSSVHSTYSALHSEWSNIEEQLKECDIKKRLNEHILARKHNEPAVSSPLDAADEGTVVEEMCKEMVDVVTKIDANGIVRTTRSAGMLAGQRENEMVIQYLKGRKNILKKLLASYPEEISEFAFPNTSISYSILMSLCGMFVKVDPKLKPLMFSIKKWGDLHGLNLSPFVMRLIEV